MKGQDQTRIQNIFETVTKSLSPRFKDLENLGRASEEKMKPLHTRLFEQIKQKCKEEYRWIEENGTFEDGPDGVNIKIKPESQNEAPKRFTEWENCASKSDFGVRDFFAKLAERQRSIGDTQEACIGGCLNDVANKSDPEITNCITDCYTTLVNSMEATFKSVNQKITEVDRQLI